MFLLSLLLVILSFIKNDNVLSKNDNVYDNAKVRV